MKKIALIMMALMASMGVFAEKPLDHFAEVLKNLGGSPKRILSDTKQNHLIIHLADSCQVEVVGFHQTNEVLLIYTSCAPICSSRARVYLIKGDDWVLEGDREPDCGGVFPQAFWENGQLIWRDNTPEWLDEEEKNRP